MTALTVTRSDPAGFDWSHSLDAQALRSVASAATGIDGREPLNEAALLRLRRHGLAGSALWLAGGAGFALVTGLDPADGAAEGPVEGPVEVDLVVHPDARGRGVGTALAQAVRDGLAQELRHGPDDGTAGRTVAAWSHGNHPAAVRLAAAFGLERTRDLWVMRRSLDLSTAQPLPDLGTPSGFDVRTYRASDADALVAVNAAAFADHPEQGAMTRADLDERMAQEWFDAAGLFVAVDGDDLLGFHWTKRHDGSRGEVYVVGIAPAAQGRGVGKHLTLAGLHHLRDAGLDEVILYVEGDNAPAVAVYSGLGFTHDDRDTDVQYTRQG